MLHQMNVINGYDHNEFGPDRLITRAEYIKMTVSAMGLPEGAADISFKDKSQIPDWAQQSFETAVAAGLVDGYEDGTAENYS